MSYTPPRSEFFNQAEPESLGRRTGTREGNGRALSGDGRQTGYPIVVHSHLCWDWVWQRPQQFLSRLSHTHKVLFVETYRPAPDLSSPLARFHQPQGFPNVTVLRLQFPCWHWEDGEYVDNERRRLVQEYLSGPGKGQFEQPVQWFYDPMAVTAFCGRMGEVLTVYDCMDELSKFRFAPPNLAQREAELLRKADVVFTGGRKLLEAKRRENRNCHFYGCGVDLEHFGSAREAGTLVPPALASLPRPVIGYFGVVDERLDYELLAKLADAEPNWSVVMVGPVLKVDEPSLPKRSNLHWLGQQAYADLPAFCKGFDVCIMPFALNDSTEFINPTKTLEYMAAGRMVVSTAIGDVARNFGSVVEVGRTADEFIELCRRAVMQPNRITVQRGLTLARQNSWDSIVERLEAHISDAFASTRVSLEFSAKAQPERAKAKGLRLKERLGLKEGLRVRERLRLRKRREDAGGEEPLIPAEAAG
jgi:glycosyltransferase involved in cell wall biosynthesis